MKECTHDYITAHRDPPGFFDGYWYVCDQCGTNLGENQPEGYDWEIHVYSE